MQELHLAQSYEIKEYIERWLPSGDRLVYLWPSQLPNIITEEDEDDGLYD